MANKTSATLDGKELLLPNESIEWPLRPGVLPTIQAFNMAPADATTLSNLHAPVELVITPISGNPVKVTNLWVLNIQPGENPYISQVVVADRRWFWDRAHVLGRYNMRRNVGVKRLLGNTNQLAVEFDRAFEIAYWDWSTNNGTKHTTTSMLTDVLSQVSQIEKKYWGQTFQAVLDYRLGVKIQQLPIEELELDDPGHEAIARALNYLPEAGITVDYDGKVMIFSRAAGDEIAIIKAAMPEIWGQGHTDLVKNDLIRPSEIHVLFTRECEVRFDFLEASAAQGATVQTEPLGNLRRMSNVIRLPDATTTINSRSMPQGTWVDIDDSMRAWGNMPLVTSDPKPLDHDILQRAFVPDMDLWSQLMYLDTPDDKATLQPWLPRIAECMARYRRTFMLNRRWTDRALSIRAYRLSTINPQTGQRGPSMAYGDYCIIPTQRSNLRSVNQIGRRLYAINKTSYPSNDNAYLDSTTLPGPGVVSVVDSDQGIIEVDYAMDLNRTYEMVLPSQMVLESIPTADVTNRERPIAFNEVLGSFKPPRLSPSFKLAVILTMVPASPNSTQQLHRIVVKPNDIKDLLPEAAQAGLNNATGPIMEIRIGAGIEVARITWDDRKSIITEAIFGLVEVPDDPQVQAAFSKDVSSMCLNEGSTNGRLGASLNQIARAQAASIYASLVDRYEGSMTGAMNGNIHLSGWISEIKHEYTAKGETYTRITFPSAIPQMSLFGFLSASERAVILKLVQP